MMACIAAHWLPFGIALAIAVAAGVVYGWFAAVRIANRRIIQTADGRLWLDARNDARWLHRKVVK